MNIINFLCLLIHWLSAKTLKYYGTLGTPKAYLSRNPKCLLSFQSAEKSYQYTKTQLEKEYMVYCYSWTLQKLFENKVLSMSLKLMLIIVAIIFTFLESRKGNEGSLSVQWICRYGLKIETEVTSLKSIVYTFDIAHTNL